MKEHIEITKKKLAGKADVKSSITTKTLNLQFLAMYFEEKYN